MIIHLPQIIEVGFEGRDFEALEGPCSELEQLIIAYRLGWLNFIREPSLIIALLTEGGAASVGTAEARQLNAVLNHALHQLIPAPGRSMVGTRHRDDDWEWWLHTVDH